MTSEPCDLHELTGCSICSGLDKRIVAGERKTFEPTGQSMCARYAGKCPRCGEWFDVSTRIYRTEAGWVCCPEA